MVSRPFPKLAFKFFGPFRVLIFSRAAAYKLELLDNSLIHLVFHVSQLKPFTPNYTPVSQLKPFTSSYTPVFSDLTKLQDLSA